jgi:hypothetical protein
MEGFPQSTERGRDIHPHPTHTHIAGSQRYDSISGIRARQTKWVRRASRPSPYFHIFPLESTGRGYILAPLAPYH